MKVECINFGEARACARTRGAGIVPKLCSEENVNVCEFWAAGPMFWARRKFEFAALDFLHHALVLHVG